MLLVVAQGLAGHLWAACSVLLADPSSQPLPQRWHLITAVSCLLISKMCADVLLQGGVLVHLLFSDVMGQPPLELLRGFRAFSIPC